MDVIKKIIKLVKSNKLLLAILALIVSLLLSIGFFSYLLYDTNAKYSNDESWDNYLETNSFYFTSDILKKVIVNESINQYNYEDLSFNIYNYDSGNISNIDIDYDISCESDNVNYSCSIDDTNENTSAGSLDAMKKCYDEDEIIEDVTESECTNQGYVYKYANNTNNHLIKVTKINPSDTSTNINITVSATSTSPYTKTLSAIYKLRFLEINDNSINSSMISDSGLSCMYMVENTYSDNQNVTLSINTTNLLFDTTNSLYINKISSTNNQGYVNSITTTLEAIRTYNIILYKRSNSYTCNNNDLLVSLVSS